MPTKSFLSQLRDASVTIDGVPYALEAYPPTLIDELCFRTDHNVAAIIDGLVAMGCNPDTAPDHLAPEITDWPFAYVDSLRENELWEASDEDVLDVLCQQHEHMRFGRSIDLNIQQGFYFNPGDGQITIGEGCDSGHVIEVLDSVCDTIDITREGEICLASASFAHHYVRDATEKVAWVFKEAKGPWMLIDEHHERKGDEFYFLVVRFLSAADDAAFRAAFPGEGE